MLTLHGCRLILTYVEICENGQYALRFLFPLDRSVCFFPDLRYNKKPSYVMQSLDGELLLTVVCEKKIRISHLMFDAQSNTYFLKKLPFFKCVEQNGK